MEKMETLNAACGLRLMLTKKAKNLSETTLYRAERGHSSIAFTPSVIIRALLT